MEYNEIIVYTGNTEKRIFEFMEKEFEKCKENNRPHLSIILWGKPGTGKSMIPILLAKKLKASLCDTFNPTEPGDSLSRLYNTVCPTSDNPLIIVLEEYDIYIKKTMEEKLIYEEISRMFEIMNNKKGALILERTSPLTTLIK